MPIVHGGRTNYGEPIGIIMLDTVFPRIPGDVGNATTFPFPVRYKIVKGASPQRVVKDADPALLKPFIQAAQELEQEGVKAIATSCGFLAIFQKELANSVNIPVLSSSLIQIKFAHALINERQKVGVLTARAQSLTERHFKGVGVQNIPKVIMGMDNAEEFTKVFLESQQFIDVEKCRQEMINAAKNLLVKHPKVGSIVLECTNMPPFAKDIQRAIKLPVFDITTLINYAYTVSVRNPFSGYI